MEKTEDGHLHRQCKVEEHLLVLQEHGVGCDVTAVNTDIMETFLPLCLYRQMGLLERDIARPLQWGVSQLHSNELELRHLIEQDQQLALKDSLGQSAKS
ncbi:hypothetical protein AVEN_202421-1 [Araneus ventricosus]|uniref:Uncharacterized protein n=1 Tax=Araneus ventricosus TaxID=182803 RepID=A0A4Y2N8B0_ARAVE|nr:hypothetical protein AVEN_202421-1 [Araneus ventricosus]